MITVLVVNALMFIVSYLIGSVPWGLVLCKIFGLGDIRSIGSGNIGATNVLRTGNKPLALATLILDSSKGALAVGLYAALFVLYHGPDLPAHFNTMLVLMGLGAILGHCFPVWLGFKGGKGVATTLGTLLAAAPWAGLGACLIWLVTALVFRISSAAALAAMAFTPVITFFAYGPTPALIHLLISGLVWYRHKENVKRLLKGEEPRMNFGKAKDDPAGKENRP